MDTLTPLFFTLSLLVLFCTFIGALHLHEQKNRKKRTVRGLELLLNLKTLFILTQQHRGLTNGYLNGDHQLRPQINHIQAEINGVYQALQNQLAWLDGISQLQLIKEQWSDVSTKIDNKSTGQNFNRHCELINALLNFIDDCAEHYTLYELKNANQRSIRYLWQELLKGVESIGQLRAIGTGVAAAGECNSVDKIRLNYLQDTVAKLRKNNDDNCPIAALLETVKNNVAIDNPKINAKEYFQQATSTLNSSVQVFDNEIETISKQVR